MLALFACFAALVVLFSPFFGWTRVASPCDRSYSGCWMQAFAHLYNLESAKHCTAALVNTVDPMHNRQRDRVQNASGTFHWEVVLAGHPVWSGSRHVLKLVASACCGRLQSNDADHLLLGSPSCGDATARCCTSDQPNPGKLVPRYIHLQQQQRHAGGDRGESESMSFWHDSGSRSIEGGKIASGCCGAL